MIPRSVPEMPNFCRVLAAPSRPVTQPTIDVPGDAPTPGAGTATGAGAAGCGSVTFGGRGGTTAACLSTLAAFGDRAPRMASGSLPRLGNGALSFALSGLCPSGNWLNGHG